MPIRSFLGRSLAGLALAAAFALPLAPTSRASLSVYVSPEHVSDRAAVVVRGEVIDVSSGLDPETGAIRTYTTIDVDRVLRGPRGLDRVVLREPGGRFGGLKHVVGGVPRYVEGEEVIAFLSPSRDGTLRTTHAFFGKFVVDRSDPGFVRASRALDGAGGFATGESVRDEILPARDVEALVAGGLWSAGASRRFHRQRTSVAPPPDAGTHWLARPPELDRLVWDDEPPPGIEDPPIDTMEGVHIAPSATPTSVYGSFVPLAPSSPARWYAVDEGGTITIDVERARDPLGDGDAAVRAVRDALAAWTDVPESRVRLVVGNGDADWTGTVGTSPAVTYPSAGNIVLFGDPYDDIEDPVDCSGTLAIGGYWSYSTQGPAVNGVTYRQAVRAYVIFNDGFECFLADPASLAEVATHEFGHALGFGHSSVYDAIMRSYAEGGRGARLGDDDRDAAHCLYPHTLAMTSPNGGESLASHEAFGVRWSSSPEAGADAGEVAIEISADGGATWSPLRASEPNDGAWTWTPTQAPGSSYRLRVARPNRISPTPSPYPDACSLDASDASFEITPPPAVAGSIEVTGADTGLRVSRGSGGAVALDWDPSCSSGASDYAVYVGSLEQLRSGFWTLSAAACSTGGSTSTTTVPDPGDLFFLVAPRTNTAEGRFGQDSSGVERPPATAACANREVASSCD